LNMKKILIYGSSFFDVIKLIEAINRVSPTWTVLGFLDDTPGIKGKSIHGYPVLGGRELVMEYADRQETYFFNNVNGTRAACQKILELLMSAHCKFATLAHPGVDLNYVKVGAGCIIPEGCVIGANVVIGDHVTLRYGCVISHDVTIEDLVLLGPGVTVGGRAILKKGCLIGAGATVLLETKVGAFSTVGAGSVVIKEVAPRRTVAGVPAREVKKRKKA
jgi:sugar O-acyltransferase (sialic acid O-acetyltransferase NeuD family)